MSDEPLTGDELASAIIDGEAAADAMLAARVAELQAAASAIAAPVPVDAERRDTAVAAALAVFDEEQATAAPVTPASAPSDNVRALRHRRINQTVLGAAAAVVVLIGAVALLTRDDTSTSDTASAPATVAASAAGAAGASEAAGEAADAANEAGAAPTSMASTSAAPPAPERATTGAATDTDASDLGDIDTPEALEAALADAFGPDRFQGTAPLAPQPCEAAVRAATADDLGVLTEAAALRWMSQPAHVLVFVDAGGAAHTIVAAEGSCAVLTRID